MSLYTPPTSGDFLPYFKYNAKAGRFYFKGTDGEVEIESPVFVADFDNVKKAWMLFREGTAPDIVYWPTLTDVPAKPTDDHKEGLELKIFSNNLFGGVAVFSSNSINTCTGISKIYAQYVAEKDKNEGKLPVISFVKAEAIKGNHGTNYEPVFAIEKWVDRPDELAGVTTEVVEAAPEVVKVAASGGKSEF